MSDSLQKLQSLQTPLKLTTDPWLTAGQRLGFWGSCFSQEMAQRFENLEVPVWLHPWGTVFSPRAMREQIRALLTDAWSPCPCESQSCIWEAAHKTQALKHGPTTNLIQDQIKELDCLFITLGSAFAYRHLPSNRWVANCHKIPQSQFEKHLFDPQSIAQDLVEIREGLHALNPQLKVVWTLSPVRHLRDGLLENSRSKAQLLSAIHHQVDNSQDRYFPSYEIAVEQLRDHRFFAEDLAHLNPWAIDFIFDRLCETWGHPEWTEQLRRASLKKTSSNHRPNQ